MNNNKENYFEKTIFVDDYEHALISLKDMYPSITGWELQIETKPAEPLNGKERITLCIMVQKHELSNDNGRGTR